MSRPILYTVISWVMGATIIFSNPNKILLSILFVISFSCIFFFWKLKKSLKVILLMHVIIICSTLYHYWYDLKNVSKIDSAWAEADVMVQGVIHSTMKIDGDQVSFDMKTIQSKEKLKVFIKLNSILEKKEVEMWGRGDSISLVGELKVPSSARNFGSFDYQRYLYYQYIHWILSVKGLEKVQVKSASIQLSSSYFLGWTDAIREFLANKVELVFSEPYRGFMLSLLLGLRNEFDPIEFEQFSQIGLTHVLAISGLHVGVVLACFMWLFKMLGFTKEKQIFFCMCLIPLYILITGAAPSVVRAGIMAIFGLHALKKGKIKDVTKYVGLAGLIMLLWNPYYLVNVSFQLSMIVTLALILMVPLISKLLPISSSLLNGVFSVTITAQLASFPLTIYYFNQFSLLSWFANLILVPLVSVIILPLGMVALMLSIFFQDLGLMVTYVIEKCIGLLFWVVDHFNDFSRFNLIWASPNVVFILLYYMVLWLSVWSWYKVKTRDSNLPEMFQHHWTFMIKKYKIAPCFTALLILLILFFYFPNFFDKTGYVRFIDVGQGDSIFIQSPTNKVILVDGGGAFSFSKEKEAWRMRRDPYEVGKDVVVPHFKKQGVHQIDYLVMSHLDFDHIGGILAIINEIPVKQIIFNGTLKDNDTVEQIFLLANEKSIPIYKVEAGQEINIDPYTNIQILHPSEFDEIYLESDQNEQSVVFKMQMYQTKFLFTGDIDNVTEKQIINSLNTLINYKKVDTGSDDIIDNPSEIDILKIAHHGSKSSTSIEWLEYWKPKAAVISVGNNNLYGHPHEDVLLNLENHNVEVYRTDDQGEVLVEVDDKGWGVRTKVE
ncbi:DNA internalization-related competence protein ComEC/Rec2 [Chengkuizengella axinellae]|uniref:DNA internalization-related competence protein ComEC/Rec2 n=1 Tax=Chengkuizengella axinellae TaxID=3064388 RepID=A0ABT9IUL5_9BACL|nr:DNA internalization-related competence protein ComEC/Rec2 [Chengkuizengella sp. 2205SS18-9]MDP5273049.1 DNA internalization-related competence protein ComEC/Rec2 [Chengkuizengella sp. 2205SS18-9]